MGRDGKEPKRRRVITEKHGKDTDKADIDTDESDIEQLEGADFSERLIPPRRMAGNTVALSRREFTKEQGFFPDSDDLIEADLGFCCAVCRCSPERRRRIPNDDQYVEPADGNLFHRRCCHGVFDLPPETWAQGYLKATDDALRYFNAKFELEYLEAEDDEDEVKKQCMKDVDEGDNCAFAGGALEWVSKAEIKKAYLASGWTQYVRTFEDAALSTPGSILETSSQYVDGIRKPFLELVKLTKTGERKRHGMKVLSAFGGIGTDLVVLKRLGLKIDRVVHIEKDMVANHVTKYNHDRRYNPDLPDDGGIEHTYYTEYEAFERDIEGGMEALIDGLGPFDLIIGGPPCQDYSKVNAKRAGTQGEQGKYMLKFLRLIRDIERNQGKNHPFFFLVENVKFDGDDLATIQDASGFDFHPVEIDSLFFSPCCRKRHYITNIPINAAIVGEDEKSAFDFESFYESHDHIPPSSCLEPGYVLAANIIDPKIRVKTNTFMASKTRIDARSTLAMYVWRRKPKKGKYQGRPMTASERSSMMGYPEGYVCDPVNNLYEALLNDGHARVLRGAGWSTKLDEKYFNFAGNFHGAPHGQSCNFFVERTGEGGFQVAMTISPPVVMKKPSPDNPIPTASSPGFFDKEEYAKRLIGLAFSVPVVEQFLKPLQHLYAHKEYLGYTKAPYKWEPKKI